MTNSDDRTGRDPAAVDARGPAIGPLHELRAAFDSSDRMEDAVERLLTAGFDRADLSLPEPNPPPEQMTPESGARAPDTGDDAQQARTLHTSGAAAAAALAAAGLAIGSGGALAPVIGAAIGAGALAGGVTFAVSKSADSREQGLRDADAAAGRLSLSVRVADEPHRERAESILRAAGATDIAAT